MKFYDNNSEIDLEHFSTWIDNLAIGASYVTSQRKCFGNKPFSQGSRKSETSLIMDQKINHCAHTSKQRDMERKTARRLMKMMLR